jgi:hypothetical protein
MTHRGLPTWLVEFVLKYVNIYGIRAHEVLFADDAYNYGCHIDRTLSCMKLWPVWRSRIFAATKFNGDVEAVRQLLTA